MKSRFFLPLLWLLAVGKTTPDTAFVSVAATVYCADISSGSRNECRSGQQERGQNACDARFFCSIRSFGLGIVQRLLRLSLQGFDLLLRFIDLLLRFRPDGLHAFNSLVYARLRVRLADVCAGSDLIGKPCLVGIGYLTGCEQIAEDAADLALIVACRSGHPSEGQRAHRFSKDYP